MNAERFSEYIQAMGLDTDIEKSRLSSSQYLTVSWGEWPENRSVKIRMADHECRPTYGIMHGFAHFEIGSHQDADGTWQDCLRWLAAQAGVSPVLRLKPNRLPAWEYRLSRILKAAIAHMSGPERSFFDEQLCGMSNARMIDRGGWFSDTPESLEINALRRVFLKVWLG